MVLTELISRCQPGCVLYGGCKGNSVSLTVPASRGYHVPWPVATLQQSHHWPLVISFTETLLPPWFIYYKNLTLGYLDNPDNLPISRSLIRSAKFPLPWEVTYSQVLRIPRHWAGHYSTSHTGHTQTAACSDVQNVHRCVRTPLSALSYGTSRRLRIAHVPMTISDAD